MLTLCFNVRVTVKHVEQRDFFSPLPIQIVPAVSGTRFRIEVGAVVLLSHMIRLNEIRGLNRPCITKRQGLVFHNVNDRPPEAI